MAQELFMTREERKRRRNVELIDVAMGMWNVHAEEYRDIPRKYEYLLSLKRKHKILPLNRLSTDIIKAFPEIPFFNICDRDAAMKQVKEWHDKGELPAQVSGIRNILDYNYEYNTMRTWVNENTYLYMRYDRNKNKRAARRRNP